MGVGHWERLFFWFRDAPLRSSERGVHSTRGAFRKQSGISFLTVPNEETGLDRRSHRLCDGAEPHLVGRRPAVGCYMVSPQSHSRWVRTPVAINEESALIVWDAEHKIEHFIRKATFQTTASHFGFLVPTPSRPELAEVKEALFTTLSQHDLAATVRRTPLILQVGIVGVVSCASRGHRARNQTSRRLRCGRLASDRSKGFERMAAKARL